MVRPHHHYRHWEPNDVSIVYYKFSNNRFACIKLWFPFRWKTIALRQSTFICRWIIGGNCYWNLWTDQFSRPPPYFPTSSSFIFDHILTLFERNVPVTSSASSRSRNTSLVVCQPHSRSISCQLQDPESESYLEKPTVTFWLINFSSLSVADRAVVSGGGGKEHFHNVPLWCGMQSTNRALSRVCTRAAKYLRRTEICTWVLLLRWSHHDIALLMLLLESEPCH